MSKLFIYGDSFSDLNFCPGGIEYQWVRKLENDYEVYNRSLSASGPEYSFRCLINDINIIDNDSYCIFISSESTRLYFKDLPPSMHCEASNVMHEHLKDFYAKVPEHMRKNIAITMSTLIDDKFKYYDTLKYFLSICNISKLFKKIVFIPLDNLNLHALKKTVPSNVYFSSKGIKSVQSLEPEHEVYIKSRKQDFRTNHLNMENHKKMYNALKQYFNKNDSKSLNSFLGIS